MLTLHRTIIMPIPVQTSRARPAKRTPSSPLRRGRTLSLPLSEGELKGVPAQPKGPTQRAMPAPYLNTGYARSDQTAPPLFAQQKGDAASAARRRGFIPLTPEAPPPTTTPIPKILNPSNPSSDNRYSIKMPHGGAVAQLGERVNGIDEVRGSNPLSSTRIHG